MIKIVIKQEHIKPEVTYMVPNIAKAIGYSEGSIQGFFARRGFSTKKGVTLDQICDCINSNATGSRVGARKGIDWDIVKEIRQRLENEKGIVIVDDNN